MFETLASWLLLPLGVALGTALARKRNGGSTPASLPADALAGLSSLVKNDNDQAIAALTRAVEAEPGTVELQMTLGSLFRKRGEIDRAIHLHEAVLARSDLNAEQAAAARYELAQDYLRAGLIDRAESVLQDLVADGTYLAKALDLLLDLYEQGRDWPHAIATAQRLQGVRGATLAPRIAQYHCEVADTARHGGDAGLALRETQKALDIDSACTRAHLALATLAEARKDWHGATRAYTRVVEQDARFLPEVIAPLARCFREHGDEAGYRRFLEDTEQDHPNAIAVTLAKATLIQAQGGAAAVQPYLAERVARNPDGRGLLAWLAVALPDNPTMATVSKAISAKLDARARYRCTNCGLQPSVLFWHCPTCKQWATIVPTQDPF
jgi:lipopolysaccharide assembly protein B